MPTPDPRPLAVADGSAAPDPAAEPGAPAKPPQRAAADRAALRSAALVGGLIVALLGGFALGRAAVPAGSAAAGTHVDPPGTAPHVHASTAAGGSGESVVGGAAGGLSSTAAGFRIAPMITQFTAGAATPFRFRILTDAGAPVTSFIDTHERKLHLVVVRRDLTGFEHVHPTMATGGEWSVPLALRAGPWHAYADFTAVNAAGKQVPVTLGVDLTVPGDYRPEALPPAAKKATTGGFQVATEVELGRYGIQPVEFKVTRNGSLPPLDRYLGAYGHLVAIRASDLGYVHVHSDASLAGDVIQFWLAPPSAGSYRMFLEFSVAGKVYQSAFTIDAP